MPAESSIDLTALNWALMHWPVTPSLVIVIRDDESTDRAGAGTSEIWTARSLRIAITQLAMKGSWNADEEAGNTADGSARDLYGRLPAALVSVILDPATTIMEKTARFHRVSAAVPSRGQASIELESARDLPDKVWELWAALAAEKDVEIKIRRTVP